MLTYEDVKKIFIFNEEEGRFYWLIKRKGANKNKIAGGDNTIGYRTIGYKGRRYLEHRLVWLYKTGAYPKNKIDHINHNRSDNRFENLREVTHSVNSKNCRLRKNNSSGFNGVYFNKFAKKWAINMMVNGEIKYFGYFKTKEDAIKKRESANLEFGFHINHGK
jgi:hypothetical protein